MNDVTKVADLLTQKNMHISFAESCTAGLAVASFADVPGTSSLLNVSFVTYSPEAKEKYAHVEKGAIDRFGIVSEEVARQMAKGCAEESTAEVGVGITGVAGPTGGSEATPVGTVCFGFYICGNTYSYTKHFFGLDRQGVRNEAVSFVFRTLKEILENMR